MNQLYADAAGRIAWFMAGKAPVRPAHDGLLPVPGDGRYDWAGFHDPGTLPRSIDPDTGWLATANEMNLPPDFPAEARKVGFEWAEPWRARRIRAVLGAQTRAQPGGFAGAPGRCCLRAGPAARRRSASAGRCRLGPAR